RVSGRAVGAARRADAARRPNLRGRVSGRAVGAPRRADAARRPNLRGRVSGRAVGAARRTYAARRPDLGGRVAGAAVGAARRTDAARASDFLVGGGLRLVVAVAGFATRCVAVAVGVVLAGLLVLAGRVGRRSARVGLGAGAALRARSALGTGAVFPAVALTVSPSTAAYLLIALGWGGVGARCDHRCGRLAGRLGVSVVGISCEGGRGPTKHENCARHEYE